MTRRWDNCYRSDCLRDGRPGIYSQNPNCLWNSTRFPVKVVSKIKWPERWSVRRHGTLTALFQMCLSTLTSLAVPVIYYKRNCYEIGKRLNLRYAYNSVQIILLSLWLPKALNSNMSLDLYDCEMRSL